MEHREVCDRNGSTSKDHVSIRIQIHKINNPPWFFDPPFLPLPREWLLSLPPRYVSGMMYRYFIRFGVAFGYKRRKFELTDTGDTTLVIHRARPVFDRYFHDVEQIGCKSNEKLCF